MRQNCINKHIDELLDDESPQPSIKHQTTATNHETINTSRAQTTNQEDANLLRERGQASENRKDE